MKTDAGPGRLSKQAISIDFREEMAQLGVHILLSLPNGTSCTAEMDQLFKKFKPACSKNALCITAKKMQVRFEVRKHLKPSTDGEVSRRKDGYSICNVSFTNCDLGHLVN